MKESGLPQSWQVVWKKEEKKLKLRGEPVLSLALSWPEIQRGGRGGRRVSQYYRQVVQTWRQALGEGTVLPRLLGSVCMPGGGAGLPDLERPPGGAGDLSE